ncbi:MAG: DHH family phosphoesterase [Candidatus Woesearchaeota archaeon]|jgi:single-stranded DNA-specific DHH superfamily exonuclease
MLTEDEIQYIRKRIKESSKPLFFFDDDPDGTTSFILLYKILNEGKGICVKGKPILEAAYVAKVEEYAPDLIVILDKPLVEQEFLDKVTQEVIWIDHHPLQDNKKVKYFNPRKHDLEDNRPTSFWAYQIAKDDVPNALWIAMIGIIGDWNILLKDELNLQYPELLPMNVTNPAEALFNTDIGKLARILEFNLKGTTTQVMQAIKTWTRIDDPYEILNQTTPRGKFIYKKFLDVSEKYDDIKKDIVVGEDKIILFKYFDTKLAISSMLSNELLYRYPDKITIIAREKNDELMLSLRSSKIKIVDKLQKALEGIRGYGGGHDLACGACVKKEDFDQFIENFRLEIAKE